MDMNLAIGEWKMRIVALKSWYSNMWRGVWYPPDLEILAPSSHSLEMPLPFIQAAKTTQTEIFCGKCLDFNKTGLFLEIPLEFGQYYGEPCYRRMKIGHLLDKMRNLLDILEKFIFYFL